MNKYFYILAIFITMSSSLFGQWGPGCPAIGAGNDTAVCNGACATLSSVPFHTGASNTYSVASIPYSPFSYTGTSVLVDQDDIYSGLINLPFNFCFFGTAYNQVVIGANGLISFNSAYAGAYCPWSYSVSLPNTSLPRNSIMGPYHDIDPAVSGDTYYQIYGAPPCRVFVVSYVNVAMYSSSCNSMKAKHQIAIYENTNAIEVYIASKPVCSSWNGGRGIVGIQDAAGTTAFFPAGQNFSTSSLTNAAWRFTPNGPANYTTSWWNGGTQIATGNTTSVCPSTTTTYTAKITYTNCDGTQVTVTDDKKVTINPVPSVTATAGNPTICVGASTSLTASGASSYTWSNGLGSSSTVNVSPTSTTTYTVTGTSAGCSNTATITVNVNSNPSISAIADPNTICSGSSTTLTASGGTGYNWSHSLGTSNPVSVSPTSTTTYSVTGTTAGCPGTATVTVNVSPSLVLSVVPSPSSICSGASATLTASGASNYSWSHSLGNGNPISVSPTSSTIYTVTGTMGVCTGTATATISVNTIPVITSNANPATICNGNSSLLSASGAATYTWSHSLGNTNPVSVSPTSSTTYTVTGTSSGCSGTAAVTINVNPNPTVSASTNPAAICTGSSATLNASGADSYAWSHSLGSSSSASVSPSSTTTYSVTGTTSGCVGSSTITVNVNPNPIISVSSSPQNICLGESSTLTASGATSYNWSNSLGNGNPITVSPTSSIAYTVTGTSQGCIGTALAIVNVNTNPVVSITASPQTICIGASSTITASGASNYNWSNGLGSSNSITISPTTTTTYSCTGSNSGCIGSSTITVYVNPNPTVSLSSNPTTICAGSNTTLTASGATDYTWSNGLGTNNPTVTSPSSTTTYTVTGSSLGCIGTASVTVNVNPIPSITASSSPPILCQGASSSLTASGATVYQWSNGIGTSNPVTVTPTSTTTYSVTGTSSGCSNTAVVSVTVNPNPQITILANPSTICVGFSSELTASGAGSYTWSNGLGNNNPISVSPTITSSYTVTGSSLGCTGTSSITVNVNPTPTITTIANPSTLCSGATSSLQASGADSYVWSHSLGNANPVTTQPSSTTIYSVTGTTSGCVGSATVTVTVNPNPIVSITANPPAICIGDSTILLATGADTYMWSHSLGTNNPITITPQSSTTYSLTGSYSTGCSNTALIAVTVNPLPIINLTPNPSIICLGETSTITASGADSYIWPNGFTPQTTNSAVITPSTASTQIYTISGTTSLSCSNTATLTIITNALPVVSISASDTAVCSGQSVSLTASGASNYQWSGNVSPTTGSFVSTSPSTSTSVTVTGTDNNGCKDTEQITITINPGPSVSFTAIPLTGCVPLLVNFTSLSSSQGDICTWNFGDNTQGTGCTISHTYNNSNNFNVTLTVQTPEGCVGTHTENNYISVHPSPIANFSIEPTIGSIGQTINFFSSSTDARTETWNFGDPSSGGSNYSIGTTPSHIYNTSGNYTVWLVVSSSSAECVDSISQVVQIINIDVTNVITANNDGVNDFFVLPNVDLIENSHIMVYNRWGRLIFEDHNYKNDWNPSEVSDGVYFWILKLPTGENLTGNVSILK